ncbi:unnamed protein product [Amoebophrya sp. A25]|nr:unnamed protein product [Amoebophrya sp. A25]|eukprot:GSA25T00015817001.1
MIQDLQRLELDPHAGLRKKLHHAEQADEKKQVVHYRFSLDGKVSRGGVSSGSGDNKVGSPDLFLILNLSGSVTDYRGHYLVTSTNACLRGIDQDRVWQEGGEGFTSGFSHGGADAALHKACGPSLAEASRVRLREKRRRMLLRSEPSSPKNNRVSASNQNNYGGRGDGGSSPNDPYKNVDDDVVDVGGKNYGAPPTLPGKQNSISAKGVALLGSVARKMSASSIISAVSGSSEANPLKTTSQPDQAELASWKSKCDQWYADQLCGGKSTLTQGVPLSFPDRTKTSVVTPGADENMVEQDPNAEQASELYSEYSALPSDRGQDENDRGGRMKGHSYHKKEGVRADSASVRRAMNMDVRFRDKNGNMVDRKNRLTYDKSTNSNEGQFKVGTMLGLDDSHPVGAKEMLHTRTASRDQSSNAGSDIQNSPRGGPVLLSPRDPTASALSAPGGAGGKRLHPGASRSNSKLAVGRSNSKQLLSQRSNSKNLSVEDRSNSKRLLTVSSQSNSKLSVADGPGGESSGIKMSPRGMSANTHSPNASPRVQLSSSRGSYRSPREGSHAAAAPSNSFFQQQAIGGSHRDQERFGRASAASAWELEVDGCGIRRSTREEISREAEKLGYTVSDDARRLRPGEILSLPAPAPLTCKFLLVTHLPRFCLAESDMARHRKGKTLGSSEIHDRGILQQSMNHAVSLAAAKNAVRLFWRNTVAHALFGDPSNMSRQDPIDQAEALMRMRRRPHLRLGYAPAGCGARRYDSDVAALQAYAGLWDVVQSLALHHQRAQNSSTAAASRASSKMRGRDGNPDPTAVVNGTKLITIEIRFNGNKGMYLVWKGMAETALLRESKASYVECKKSAEIFGQTGSGRGCCPGFHKMVDVESDLDDD